MDRYIFAVNEGVVVRSQWGGNWSLTGMHGIVLERQSTSDDVYKVRLNTGLTIEEHGSNLRSND